MRNQTTRILLFLGTTLLIVFTTACSSPSPTPMVLPTIVIESSPTPTIPPTMTPETKQQPANEEPDIFSFTIVDETGAVFDLTPYKGTPFMLIFFSVRCGHCHHEAEDLESLYRMYQDKINIIALEVSGAGNEEVTEFAETYGLTFPVTSDFSLELTRAMGITGVPTNLLFRSDGTRYDTLRGYHTPDDFETAIDQFLLVSEP